jgi:hypothetical protein
MLLQIIENPLETVLSEKYNQNLPYHQLYSTQKKYFVVCRDCFWMSSTLTHASENRLINYKKCPMCENTIDKFSIPNL